MEKIKVLWLCSVSNNLSRRYTDKPSFFIRLGYKLMGKAQLLSGETGIWITNALNEFENIDEVELHVVSPQRYLKQTRIDVVQNTIHYHLFRDEESSFIKMLIRHFLTRNSSRYRRNRKLMKSIVNEVNPDVVHCIGLENPYYSMGMLDISDTTPKIAQLAALLASILDKPNIARNPAKLKNFTYKANIEKEIIRRVDYVGLNDISWARFITENISKDVEFLHLKLAMASSINLSNGVNKEYDFVYFSLNLSKAVDLALAAFAEYHKKNQKATLDVIGAYSSELKHWIDQFIIENNLTGFVSLEGRMETHDELIAQIRKAKAALLPLKTDTLPTVIREAMANGLPVITTITDINDGTPILNQKRESVLLSEIGDVVGMAENMEKLLDDKYAKTLIQNAAITISELGNNYDYMHEWVDAYRYVLSRGTCKEAPERIRLKY